MGARTGRGGSPGARKFFAEVRERLLAFAAHEFKLEQRQPDGTTAREHLQNAAERGNALAAAELAGPECPDGAEHVWLWFMELSMRRRWNETGAQALSYSEIAAWRNAHGIRLARHELEWLLALDRIYRLKDEKESPA